MNPIQFLRVALVSPVWLPAVMVAAALAGSARADLLINEVDATTSGNAASGLAMHDYVELLNTGAASMSLTGKAVVLYRGTAGNNAYDGMDLDSFTIAGGGYLTVGGYATPTADVVVEYSAAFAGSPLLAGPAGATVINGEFIPDQAATAVANANILDGLMYKPTSIVFPAGSSQAALRDLLHSTTPEVNEAGPLLDTSNQSMGRGTTPGVARNTSTYAVGSRTPGTGNDPSLPRLGFQWTTANSISEAAGTITGKFTRTGSTASAVIVTISNKDFSEWSLPDSVVIPAGATESATFQATAVDDKWKDGSMTVYFHGTAAGYSPTAGWGVVTDDETGAPLAVTEVHSHVFNDANGDGATNVSDQFVEIVNISTLPQNISGFKIVNETAEQFIFPDCSVLAPGSAAVVFRGVTAAQLRLSAGVPFGGAAVYEAPGLSLGERGGALRLRNTAGDEVAGLTYWPYPSGSNTTDVTGTVIQKKGHSLVTGATGLTSPGKKPDGTVWETPLEPVVLTFTRACVSRLEPTGAVILEVRVPARNYPVTVCLRQEGAGLVTLPDLTVDFPANAAEAVQLLDLTPVTTPAEMAGDATATFSVDGTGVFKNTAPKTLAVIGTLHADTSTLLASSIVESAGTTASAFTFKLDGPVATATQVTFSIVSPVSGAGVALPQTTATIPANADTVAIPLNALPNTVASGAPQTVILQALETTTCRGIRRTLTVVDDGGIAAGPFLNEIEADPLASFDYDYVEISAPASTSLNGFTLAAFDASGTQIRKVALTGSTGANGLYLIHEAGMPGTSAARQDLGTDLPAAGGALALYRGTPPNTLTTDNLVDAVVYGSGGATLRNALLPVFNAGVLGGDSAVSVPPSANLQTMARTAVPAAAPDLRQPLDWQINFFGTPLLLLPVDQAITLNLSRPCVSRLEAAPSINLVVGIPDYEFPVAVDLTQTGTGVQAIADPVIIPAHTPSHSVPLLHLTTPADADASATFALNGIGIWSNAASLELDVIGTQHAAGSRLLATSIVESAGSTASAFIFKLDAPVAAATNVAFTILSGSGVSLAQSSATIPAGQDTVVIALNAAANSVPPGSPQTVVIQGLATGPAGNEICKGITESLTVIDDGGITDGPFLSEVEADPLASFDHDYVEISAPASTSLNGFTQAVYDASGTQIRRVALTGSTGSNGLYLVHEAGMPGTSTARQELGIDLPNAGGAVALYRGTPPATLTTDNLVDALVYGSGGTLLRNALLPVVSAGALSGGGAVSSPPAGTLQTLARTAVPTGAANLRQPANWQTNFFGTPLTLLPVNQAITLNLSRSCVSRLEATPVINLVLGVPDYEFPVAVALTQTGAGVQPVSDPVIVPLHSPSHPIALTHLTSPETSDASATFALNGMGIWSNATPRTLDVVGTQHASASSLLASSIVESAGSTASAFTFKLDAAVAVNTPVTFSVVSPAAGASVVPAQATVTIPAGADSAVVALNAVPNTVASGAPQTVILQAMETTTCRAVRKTITVIDDGGIANGPFLNEIEADPLVAAGDFEFVEIATQGGASLAGFSLAVFGPSGTLVQTVALTGSASASGHYLIHDPGLPGSGNRQSAELDLADAGGAVALYRGAPPASLSADNLIDALAYGTAAANVRTALHAEVTYPPGTTGGLLGGRAAAAAPAAASLATLARTAAPASSINLRHPANWAATAFGTPALAVGSSSFAVWAAAYGVSGDCNQFLMPDSSAIPPVAPVDTDGDGNPNWLEFIAGSNPTAHEAPFGWTISGTAPTLAFSIHLNPIALADTAHFTLTPQKNTTGITYSNTSWTTAPTPNAPTGIINVNSTTGGPRNLFRLKVVCTP